MKTPQVQFQNISPSKSEHFTLVKTSYHGLRYFMIFFKYSIFSVKVQCATANRLKCFTHLRNEKKYCLFVITQFSLELAYYLISNVIVLFTSFKNLKYVFILRGCAAS